MKNLKNKKISTIALILVLAFSATLVALPTANAQERYKTFPFISVSPNPIGVGQETLLYFGLVTLSMRPQDSWTGLTVTVTKPDDTTETLGPYNTDFTGGTGAVYLPTMVGTYYLQTNFPEQVCVEGTRDLPAGTIMEAATSEQIALIVQQEPLTYYPGHSLPEGYWTRPIDAQLREWYNIAGNWLATPPNSYAQYTAGPETGHILWAKPIALGGLVGGERGFFSYECGSAYEGKFSPAVIINGILYYNEFSSRGGLGATQGIIAVDLRTGEELWFKNNTRLSHGQLLMWDSFNYHGTFAYLWEVSGSTWNAYDAFTGEWTYSMEDVPSGSNIYGPNGEILRYTLDLDNGWMTMWNSTKVVNPQNWGTSRDGSWGRYIGTDEWGRVYPAEGGIQWNVSIPTGLTAGEGQFAGSFRLEDRIIYTDFQYRQFRQDSYRIFAISTEPGKEGTLLFDITWTPPTEDVRGELSAASVEDGVFTINIQSTRQIYGFDIDTGEQLWISEQMHSPLDTMGMREAIVDGKYYTAGYGGTLYCYDVKTGEILWTYDVADPYTEILWGNNWPVWGMSFADGKVYLFHGEHSPIDPKPRGAPLTCVDAETGEEIFVTNHYGSTHLIGDGILVGLNSYDNRIYAFGKGPSQTTVEAPLTAVPLGSSVVIRGMVTDVSAGTKEPDLMERFPNGVGAVADEYMTEWMQCVYHQFEYPADAEGVEVTLDTIDPNGNWIHIGRVTSDMSGMFKKMWTPDIEGEYTIMATFEGSESYGSSYAETAIGVGPAPSPAQPIEPEPTEAAEAPLITTEIAILIAVVVVAAIGIVAYWTLRKRK